MSTTIIGFPRLGEFRELKFTTEKYFRKEISEEELLAEKAELLRKGLVQIGALGHFLRDGNGRIWELRKEGDLI